MYGDVFVVIFAVAGVFTGMKTYPTRDSGQGIVLQYNPPGSLDVTLMNVLNKIRDVDGARAPGPARGHLLLEKGYHHTPATGFGPLGSIRGHTNSRAFTVSH
jgi:hypothetical protein